MGDAHDRGDDLHRHVEFLQRLRLVGCAPDVGVGRVGLLRRVAVRQSTLDEELTHALAAAEFVDEVGVEPRLVDPQRRVHEEPVAVEALDVVALVGRPVAPDVHAIVLHCAHEQCAGDRPTERRRVEVGATRCADVERTALQRDEALVDELVTTVDEARLLGAVDLRAGGDACPVPARRTGRCRRCRCTESRRVHASRRRLPRCRVLRRRRCRPVLRPGVASTPLRSTPSMHRRPGCLSGSRRRARPRR